MKTILSHAFSFILGLLVAALSLLYLAKSSSLVWQNELKGSAAYSLQIKGAKAASAGNWADTQHEFETSEWLRSDIKPREWKISFPLFGWSVAGLVAGHDSTFSISDKAILAYALDQQGKHAEADSVYQDLLKSDPSKDRSYYTSLAKQDLSTLSNAQYSP
jgi:hypothetical protein